MNGQGSLFGVALAVGSDAAPTRQRAPRQRMARIECPACGELFLSFVRGVRCDDCRKQKRAERKERPVKTGRVSEYGYIDEFPPGF